MRLIIFFGFIFINACTIMMQQKGDLVKISNGFMYDYFENGYMNGSPYVHYDYMIEEGVERIHIADVDLKRFEKILNSAKKKTINSFKFGGQMLFLNFNLMQVNDIIE